MARSPAPLVILLAGLALLAGMAAAQTSVYRSVDSQGNVTYSDTPIPGGEKVRVDPVQTFEALPGAAEVLKRGEDASAPAAAGPPYAEFAVVSPAGDEAYRSNSGAVAVGLRVVPDLRHSDSIEVLLDGRPIGSRDRSTARTLLDVGRGTHSLEAVIYDGQGTAVARTAPITFHLLRVHR